MALVLVAGLLWSPCAGLGAETSGEASHKNRTVPGSTPNPAIRAQHQWRGDRLCFWPVEPKIIRGSRLIGLNEAELSREGFPVQLEMLLDLEGERLVLDLLQNRELLASARVLVYYLPNGTRTMRPSGAENNCCYRGDVRSHPNSRATVCICSGLSGLLVLSKERGYTLEPSETGPVRAYRLNAVKQETGKCRVVSPSRAESGQMSHHRAKRDAEFATGCVELVIVADQAEFKLNPDIERTRIRMLEIASHMDGFYRTLGLRVALVGLEIWNDRDHIPMDGSPPEILERFLRWSQVDLRPRIPHDSVQLITGSPFPSGTIGTSIQGSICSKRAVGISMDHSVSPLVMASTLSHQLGHNLGFGHDGAGCGCDGSSPNLPPGRSCIMEPPTGITPGLSFSSCTHQQVAKLLQSDRSWCLRDMPDPTRLEGSFCGNHLVEAGEECDCGLRLECTDPCCNASACDLFPGAQCATGQACCHSCQLRNAGFACRPSQSECDLPEFCSGDSPHCPANFHKQDGTPCEGGQAVCYGGTCPTYDSQCQELWGPGSVPVSDACVASLNSRGDPEGNCGRRTNGSYIPCAKSNVWCGQLQCQGGGSGARRQNRRSRELGCPHKTPPLTDDILDSALAWPGTICGSNKVCLEKKCQDLSSLKTPSCQCNGHGVCNNRGHCHCEPGWAPPDCWSSGIGGSADSGPPTKEQGSGTTTAVVLSILFVLLLLVPGLYCAKRIGLHKRLCQIGKGTSCQYRITQPEPRSYSRGGLKHPRPPQWRPTSEFQPMSNNQAPVPAKPPLPRKPLPSDPAQVELSAVSGFDLRVQMLPSRPAPPPPPATNGSSAHIHEI